MGRCGALLPEDSERVADAHEVADARCARRRADALGICKLVGGIGGGGGARVEAISMGAAASDAGVVAGKLHCTHGVWGAAHHTTVTHASVDSATRATRR